MTACPPSNPFCAEAPLIESSATSTTLTTSTTCSELPIDLTPAGVNIMIAVDGLVHEQDLVNVDPSHSQLERTKRNAETRSRVARHLAS